MRFSICCLLVSVAITGVVSAAEPELKSIRIESPEDVHVVLSGPDSGWQLVITGETKDGRLVDVTSLARFESDEETLSVNRDGLSTPRRSGVSTVRVHVADQTTELKVTVTDIDEPRTLNFVTDVAPIFTRAGCNSGGCHGKTGGQEGFELALLGFEPELDYDRLTKDGDGYRVDLDRPADSYLLKKATRAEPHSGGGRIRKDSPEYRLITRWISQGAPRGTEDDSIVERIEVFPKERILLQDEQQRLLIVAHLSDGSIRDVTRLSRFESNATEILKADEHGIVSPDDLPGVGAVMVRYQAHVSVFRGIVPTGRPVNKDDLPESSNFIDELVFRQLQQLGIPSAETCDDNSFIRRATIDICGRLPTVEEVTQFVEDANSKKNEELIDRLLASEGYADYFANKWSSLLHNRRNSARDPREPTVAFHKWIRDAIRENRSFDDFVRGVLTATGEEVKTPPAVWYRVANEPSSQLEDVAQLFLGQRIQCARCHHHPFEKWSQGDYYGMAAFFSRVEVEDRPKGKKEKQKPPLKVSFKTGQAEARHPKTDEKLRPTPLEAPPLSIDENTDPRGALVDWMTRKDNRFFARIFANRYWKHFLGRGLVEPEDDLRVTNPPTNPELLDALAQHFVDSGFDGRELIRIICTSTTYRLSSSATELNAADRQNYSHFLPRRLTAEVYADAIDTVTLMKTKYEGVGGDVRAVQLPDNQSGSYMLNVFGRPAGLSACECERRLNATLSQRLHMINSPGLLEKVHGERTKQLVQDKRPHEERIRDLYQVALSRKPEKWETDAILAHLTKRGAIDDGSPADTDASKPDMDPARRAYADIVWALINTKEFAFNH